MKDLNKIVDVYCNEDEENERRSDSEIIITKLI